MEDNPALGIPISRRGAWEAETQRIAGCVGGGSSPPFTCLAHPLEHSLPDSCYETYIRQFDNRALHT